MPDPPVAVEEIDQLGELVEVASQRSLGPGRVLEQHRAALGGGEGPRDPLGGPLHGRAVRLALARPGVQDDAMGADSIADP